MKFFKQIDLTEGKPWKVILLFSIPILLSLILSNAFSLINALVLKVTVGGDSVTAINSTASISQILFNFAYGCSGGFAILLSSYFGKKDYDNLKMSFYNGLYLSIIVGLIITVLGLFIYEDLIKLLNINEVYFYKAKDYYFIILFSFVLMVLANYLSNALRAIGDSSAPLVISLSATVLNVLFAFLFTGLIKWDTRGVAIATLLANLINVIVSVVYIHRKYEYLRIHRTNLKLDKGMSLHMLKLGLPLGLQWSVLFVGSFVQSRTINGFGNGLATKAVSCYSPIEQYLCMPLHAMSSALLSYVAQNYGNNDWARIRKGVKQVIVVDICVYLLACLIGFILIDYAPYIFLPLEEVEDIVNGPIIKYYVSTYLTITIPFYILQGLLTISRSILQGVQRPSIPFISGIGELFARIFVCLVIPSLINPINPISNESFIGVCFSTPFAWFVSVVIMGGSVIYFFKKNKAINV